MGRSLGVQGLTLTSVVVRPIRTGALAAGRLALVSAAVLWTDGGQGTARRNAWASMVTDARRRRDRADADADAALTLATAVSLAATAH